MRVMIRVIKMTRSWEEMLSDPIEGEEYNGQVSESEQPLEPLCGDHLVPVSQCDCLWGYKRERGGK